LAPPLDTLTSYAHGLPSNGLVSYNLLKRGGRTIWPHFQYRGMQLKAPSCTFLNKRIVLPRLLIAAQKERTEAAGERILHDSLVVRQRQ
jgi:hypothetical protein